MRWSRSLNPFTKDCFKTRMVKETNCSCISFSLVTERCWRKICHVSYKKWLRCLNEQASQNPRTSSLSLVDHYSARRARFWSYQRALYKFWLGLLRCFHAVGSEPQNCFHDSLISCHIELTNILASLSIANSNAA